MGCKNSKVAVQVAPVMVKPGHAASNFALSKDMRASEASIRSGERPSKSATSKVSKHSHDSGYSGQEEVLEDDDGDAYAGMITENSDATVVEEIERTFVERDLDFCLMGTAAPRNLSAKDKARLDEQRILEDLRNEGLIATSKFEAKSGLAFDVVEAKPDNAPRRALPARLAKLEKRKKKKKTKEDIDAKLEKAEQRRKEAEQEKLEKINSVTTKSDVTHVQEEQVKHQQEVLESTLKKVDTVTEKREQRLQELKEKLRAREEHAQKVRSRRKIHIPTDEELAEMERASKEAGVEALAPADTAEQARGL